MPSMWQGKLNSVFRVLNPQVDKNIGRLSKINWNASGKKSVFLKG